MKITIEDISTEQEEFLLKAIAEVGIQDEEETVETKSVEVKGTLDVESTKEIVEESIRHTLHYSETTGEFVYIDEMNRTHMLNLLKKKLAKTKFFSDIEDDLELASLFLNISGMYSDRIMESIRYSDRIMESIESVPPLFRN